MGARRQWTATALLLVAAQVVFFVWLELAFGVSALVHAVLLNGASVALTALAALIPSGLGASLGVLVSFLGLGWFYHHLVAPSLSGGAGAGFSTLAGALVGPIYFGCRRLILSVPKERKESPSPEASALDPQMAKADESIPPASTAV